MGPTQSPLSPTGSTRGRTFRRAVLHGLALLLPPLLTVAIVLWVARSVEESVWQPAKQLARDVIVEVVADINDPLPDAEPTDNPTIFVAGGTRYKQLENGQFVPAAVYQRVLNRSVGQLEPTTGREVYDRYVDATYLTPWLAVPLFVCAILAVTYLLGRFLAAGIGRVFWNVVERGVDRVPVVSSVYSSVKQVTDFMLTESDLQFTRVVALEFPCKGTWQVGFVTGEGMRDVDEMAGEPVVAVLVSTAPIPVTGYTLMAPKSELIDLNITIDQACEYFLSCGVSIPGRGSQTPPPAPLAGEGVGNV